jgi:hypothetical protein
LRAEVTGGTALAACMQCETAELRKHLAAIVVPANEQNVDRLEAELAHLP